MRKGRFTKQEIKYLKSLDAVANATPIRIIYKPEFKNHFLEEYYAGGSPKKIFEDAGLLVSMLGYKRIERSCARWKKARNEGRL